MFYRGWCSICGAYFETLRLQRMCPPCVRDSHRELLERMRQLGMQV